MLGDWANSGNIQISGLESSDGQDEVPQYLKNVLDPEARKDILVSLKEAQEKASNLKSAIRRVVDPTILSSISATMMMWLGFDFILFKISNAFSLLIVLASLNVSNVFRKPF